LGDARHSEVRTDQTGYAGKLGTSPSHEGYLTIMTGAEAPAAHNLGQAFRRLSRASTYRDEPGTLMGKRRI
jgi:hypothetical protein